MNLNLHNYLVINSDDLDIEMKFSKIVIDNQKLIGNFICPSCAEIKYIPEPFREIIFKQCKDNKFYKKDIYSNIFNIKTEKSGEIYTYSCILNPDYCSSCSEKKEEIEIIDDIALFTKKYYKYLRGEISDNENSKETSDYNQEAIYNNQEANDDMEI